MTETTRIAVAAGVALRQTVPRRPEAEDFARRFAMELGMTVDEALQFSRRVMMAYDGGN